MAVQAHPHPEIRALAEANGERLHHFRADLFWTISTGGTTEHDQYRYATYHSPIGAAVIEIGNADDEDCRLSNRQLHVMMLGAIGLGTKETGERLCLSDNTIKTHRSRIKELLGIAKNDGPGVEPSIIACFEGTELSVIRPLPRTPAKLRDPLAHKVLRSVGQGATNSVLALELGLEEHAVKAYRCAVYGATHIIRSSAEATTLLCLSPPEPQSWPPASAAADTA